ncbi:MAG: UDP-N-acetylmuramoyl-L-alanine--D-glutamate ligase [Candidatus Omnitrophota bacterium]
MANVLVVGIAKSGICASRLLRKRRDTVFITDIKDDKVTRSAAQRLIREGVVKRSNAELGAHTEKLVKKCGLVIVSPGVRPDALPVALAEKMGIPVISELELGYSMCPSRVIAVTGTSGKTTTATLIGQMLKASGRDAVVCGNIGNPFTGEIDRLKKDSLVVVEASSFQLERIDKFKPRVSVILNISTNHLDRHADMNEYISAKLRIFLNQDENDVTLLNKGDELLNEIAEAVKGPRVEFFDEYGGFGKRCGVENEDFLAAMSGASLMGASEEKMLEVIRAFKGIEHRLEHVASVKDIHFINDSKATTISSVEWALRSLDPGIVLIMGGRYKGGDFGALKGLVRDKVDRVIAIGEARPNIRQGLDGVTEIFEAGDLSEAVEEAFKKARKNGRVLLSPGCSSFDMFKNYEERGNVFKRIVQGLK